MSKEVKYLKDYKSPDHYIENTYLEFTLGRDVTTVSSKLDLITNKEHAPKSIRLDGQDLELLEVKLDGKTLSNDQYTVGEEFLEIPFTGDKCQLETKVRIHPDKNKALEGLYGSSNMVCTQCEPEGFRKITYYMDRPDVMSVFTVKLIGEKDQFPYLLANGNLVESGQVDEKNHYAVWNDPFKKPSYLFAVVAGDLVEVSDTYKTVSGRIVDLKFYVEKQNKEKCQHAIDSLKRSMEWDEKRFGREYDLDIYMVVATDDFNMGAMENKGLNIFNSKYVLANPQTATDVDYEGIERVIGHEYFHNWTGNRITCRDWFQLSLKEGLTVFRDQEFGADMTSRGVSRVDDVTGLKSAQFPEDAGPMSHPIRPESYIEMNNFYTSTVYEKGAEVIRMIHTLLGEDKFRKSMDLYFERHDGEAVTCEDFVKAMEDGSGVDLSKFRIWYSQAGTPKVSYSESFDSDSGELKLSLSQKTEKTPGQDTKHAVHIPVKMAMLSSSGEKLSFSVDGKPTDETVVSLMEESQEFIFKGLKEKPILSLFRGFSSPVIIETKRDDSELKTLALFDDDPYCKVSSVETLTLNELRNMAESYRKGVEAKPSSDYISLFKELIALKMDDLSLKSALLSIPSEAYVCDQFVDIDPVYVGKACESLKTSVAESCHSELKDLFSSLELSVNYSYNQRDVGVRRIKNTLLGLVARYDHNLPLNEYKNAKNMTEESGALAALVTSGNQEAFHCLDSFHEKWKHEPLVVNKWLALNTVVNTDDILGHIKKISQHSSFDMTNPNKVYSFFIAFVARNRSGFHGSSKESYKWYFDQILKVDSFNPQVASRMIKMVNRISNFTEERKNLLLDQFKRLKAHEGLSSDVYEVAHKTIEANS